MANEPVKTWQESFGSFTGRGLWRAGELGYAAASQVGGVAMSGGTAAGTTAVAGAAAVAMGAAATTMSMHKTRSPHCSWV